VSRIVIVGGGAAGSFSALLLARAGHQVAVLDRDRLGPAPDVEAAAASAFRASAPQIVQPHIIMARCRQLLIERLPDVYDGLLAAGVAETQISTRMPPTLVDRSARPGDERLTMLMTRRSTLDWVLQRRLLEQPGVTLHHGVRVIGLLAEAGSPPHVTGVRTDQGDLGARVVVDATGRRSAIDRWLADIAARPAATRRADCGLAYYCRHYRLRSGADLPGPPNTRILMSLDEFTAGIWGGDNGTMKLAVAPLDVDRRFRTLRYPDVFTAVLRIVPTFAAWLDVLDPITDVFPMAGLHNTLRRLVVGGAPVTTGLLAVGDSVCTTNPTFGRGLTMSLVGAADLAEALDEHGGDPTRLALALDGAVAEHVAPFYEDQAVVDAARLAVLRHTIFDAPAPAPPPADSERVGFAQLRTAAHFDPTAFRALWEVGGMIRRPDQVYADPTVVACVLETLGRHPSAPPLAQPSRERLLAALAARTGRVRRRRVNRP
jgi:2-polyprenyl-6-methoxyphenol hydroxylase-like FAD-dependent oxidoreductase